MTQLIDVSTEYAKNENLKKEEVDKIMDWVKTQPHLPEINELQAIFFLHACYYNEEAARKTLDTFFTIKSLHPDLFKQRNPWESPVKESLDVLLVTPLPKKSPDGYTIILIKTMDVNPKNLHYNTQVKIFDMIAMLLLHQDGSSEGYIILFDMKGLVFSHLFRVSLYGLKTLMFYVQEGLPGRIKGLYFFNTVPFMGQAMALLKPFLKKELADIICLHKTVDDLVKDVPLECLPEDYGGTADATSVLHEKMKKKVFESVDFFEWEDRQTVDESKRPK